MLIGLVGLPSSGKSTFFKAATLADVAIANYPFTTINKNEGAAFVSLPCVDKDFNVQCNPREGFCKNHVRFVPVKLIDVAGLIEGAHEGEGMGNQFLDDLRQADVLIQVVDISGSTNNKGESCTPLSNDPEPSIRILEREIDMWYLGILKKGWEKFARQVQQEKQEIKKALAKQLSGLKVTEEMIEEGIKNLKLLADPTIWTDNEMYNLAVFLRKKTKPMVIACNKIDVPGADANYKKLREKYPDRILTPCSADCEVALRQAAKKGVIEYLPGDRDFKLLNENLPEQQKKALEFIKQNILKWYVGGTGVQTILNTTVFGLLGYIAIFPGGANKLQDSKGNYIPDCFLMPKGTTALDFAYRLHTDIGNNFVKAINAKTKMAVGKDYKLASRDVIEIMTSK